MKHQTSSVNVENEWGELEEVIVGDVAGARFPPVDDALIASAPDAMKALLTENAGRKYPDEIMSAAARELDGLCAALEREGVIVRRPEAHPHSEPFSTPHWRSASGIYAAMPRDVALVIGNTIIEAPMAWRSRYFEIHAYRELFKEYFRGGCHWIAAPRPILNDDLYQHPETLGRVTELEPVFDAADFIRCGEFLVGQISNVTNRIGIEWLQRHLPEGHEIVLIEPNDKRPMHIDATIMPLNRRRLLVNPDRVTTLPAQFDDWDVRPAPLPQARPDANLFLSSGWISMNLLSLNEKTVFVESGEIVLADMLEDWGFDVLRIPFRNFNSLGGSFHCATLDIRRAGS